MKLVIDVMNDVEVDGVGEVVELSTNFSSIGAIGTGVLLEDLVEELLAGDTGHGESEGDTDFDMVVEAEAVVVFDTESATKVEMELELEVKTAVNIGVESCLTLELETLALGLDDSRART